MRGSIDTLLHRLLDPALVPPAVTTLLLSWKTRIIATREIPAGTPVGYNGAWTAKRRTRLGVIPVGYGDGFTRHLSSAGRVIVREQYSPIVGNVSMDLSTIDLTDVTGADIGDDQVELGSVAGRDRRRLVDAGDVGQLAQGAGGTALGKGEALAQVERSGFVGDAKRQELRHRR